MSNRSSMSAMNTVSDVVTLREAMDRLFNESIVGGPFRSLWANGNGNSGGRANVPLSVYATADEVIMIASVPGLGPEDIEVSVNDNTITLAGQLPNVTVAQEAKEATWYLHELGHGSFRRAVTLAFDIDADAADATFDNGILRLTLPKAERNRPRQIAVRRAESDTSLVAGGEDEHDQNESAEV